ncbi:hypothetical protein LIER_38255 [Lithospermum erythrorhizon]|uniref:GAG-pre-integrase domain-containing protein n=1 Tax=Lithospermum erythrorhizon TaxID=34254 RepID=A0AAV3PYW4_LITER
MMCCKYSFKRRSKEMCTIRLLLQWRILQCSLTGISLKEEEGEVMCNEEGVSILELQGEGGLSMIIVKYLVTLYKDLSADVCFTPCCCFLQGPSLKASLVVGRRYKGLYVLDDHCSQSTSSSNLVSSQFQEIDCHVNKIARLTATTNINSDCSINEKLLSHLDYFLWHCRLGHLHLDQIWHVFKTPIVSLKNIRFICQICPKARQTR